MGYKTAIVVLAFLPQFVEVSRGHVAMQVAVLGLLFTALGFVTDGCYALAAGTAGNWLKRSRGYLACERYVSGVLFIGLGSRPPSRATRGSRGSVSGAAPSSPSP